MPTPSLPTVCDIHTGLNGVPGAVRVPAVDCRLVPQFQRGIPVGIGQYLLWSHYVIVNSNVDVRDDFDPLAPAFPQTHADVIEIPSGSTNFYLVQFVHRPFRDEGREYTKVYLIRLHVTNWASFPA